MTEKVEKILLVDDEPRLLSGLRRNLGLKFPILTAESGSAALDVIAENPDIAVIIADMQMPVMNGVELLQEVKERAPEIRRMMLTGNSDQETAIAAVNEGAVMRFMRKPCDPATLEDAINYALEDYRFSVAATTDISTQNSGMVARDSFLSMMNHEIRTPLHHIIGLAQLISIPDIEENEQSRKFLSSLQDSADHLLYTLVRMLDYSRVSSQDIPITSNFDFIELMKDEVDKVKDIASAKQITVGFDCLRRHSEFIGAKEDIALAIREILTNAVKFNKVNGHVGVTLRRTEDSVDVKITDTGMGMSDADLLRVTGAFTQADESHIRNHDGIGLGLSLASAIAESHAGALSLNSTEGNGTTAILSFRQANAFSDVLTQ